MSLELNWKPVNVIRVKESQPNSRT